MPALQKIQQIRSSSAVFPRLPFDFEYETFRETSNYIKKERPSAAIEELKPQRNIVETSAILQAIGDIDLLKEVYLFQQTKEIKTYLWNNRFLLDILFEAYEQIINVFGKGIELNLELHRDYEEDFEELFIVIKSSLEPNVMLALMDKLDDEWFLGAMDSTKGKLNITVEPL